MSMYLCKHTRRDMNLMDPVSSFGGDVVVLGAEKKKVSCATTTHMSQVLDYWGDCAVHLSSCQ